MLMGLHQFATSDVSAGTDRRSDANGPVRSQAHAADQRTEAQRFTDDLLNFVQRSPSAYHAAEHGALLLERVGFVRVDPREPWPATPGRYLLVRGGALIAWVVPERVATEGLRSTGIRILGAHNDSPGFKLKAHSERVNAGFGQAAVEVYGGPQLASWLDRELRLAGRVILRSGETKLVATGPLLRIPHLAIHLDREANSGLTLDRERHLQPIYACLTGSTDDAAPDSVLAEVAREAKVEPEDILTHDLLTVDAQPGQRFGHGNMLVASGRLDNLASVYPGLCAIAACGVGGSDQNGHEDNDTNHADIAMLACFDHEEIGSHTATGAAGPLLEEVLTRTLHALGASSEQQYQVFARSSCASMDVTHALHPNYPERYDVSNSPLMGQGVTVKLNAQQRYATDATTHARWLEACEHAGTTAQHYVGNNSVPCGSTIGPITATRLGIPTVDVGVPVLSMHSARELAHVNDLLELGKTATSYLVG